MAYGLTEPPLKKLFKEKKLTLLNKTSPVSAGLVYENDGLNCRSVQIVPKPGHYPTEDISQDGGNHDQKNGCSQLKFTDGVRRLDEMQPENPIHERLG